MARALSLAARTTYVAQHADDTELGLITIRPAGGGDPVYLCTDAVERLSVDPLRYGVRSRGKIYDVMALRLVLPGSADDELPSTSIELDNIDPSLIQAVQSSVERATFDLEVIQASRPDEVVRSWPAMEINDATFDDDVVTLSVGYVAQGEEPAVMHKMTVNVFPALRGAV